MELVRIIELVKEVFMMVLSWMPVISEFINFLK